MVAKTTTIPERSYMIGATEAGRSHLGRDDFYNQTHNGIGELELGFALPMSASEIVSLVPQAGAMDKLAQNNKSAEILRDIMVEFINDNEAFQPSVDNELKDWLKTILLRENSGITEHEADSIIAQIEDHPPSSETQSREIIARNEDDRKKETVVSLGNVAAYATKYTHLPERPLVAA